MKERKDKNIKENVREKKIREIINQKMLEKKAI